MATIKDKITLAMLPSAQSGGASTSTTDFSGTVHSLLPIQHETPDLVDIIPNTTDVNTGGVYTDVTWISDHDFGIGDLLKVTFTLKGLSSTTRAWGYNEFYPKDNVTEYTDGTYTAYWDVISSSSITRAFRFYQASSPRTGTISIDRVVKVVNGDFDFERSSSATRVGSDGYIKNVEVLSNNLVQNGDFEDVSETELITNGDFSNGGQNWTPQAGNFEVIQGKVVVSHTNATSFIVQSNVAQTGKIYRVEFTISDYSEGRIRLRKPFINGELENNPRNGTFVYYGEAVDQAFELQSRFTEDANYKVDNISVKEVGQNWNFTSGSSFTENGIRIQANGTYENFSQDNVMTVGKTYKVTYEVTEVNSGGIKFNTSFGLNSGVPSTLGVHSIYATANISNLFFERNGTADITIDNISVKEVTRDTDISRLDFSNSAQPSLLLEPQRSNLITSSEYVVDGSYGYEIIVSGTLNNNVSISPNGLENAFSFGGSGFVALRNNVTLSTNTTYTFSFYAKNVDASGVNYRVFDRTNTSDLVAQTSYFSQISSSEWTRVEFSFTTNSTSTQYGVYPSSGNQNGTMEFYGLQLEEGSYATSYIPTNGSTVTRLADVCNNAGDSTIFNDDEGVLFVDMKALADDLTYRAVSLHDGTVNNRVTIRYRPTSNAINGLISSNGSNVFNSSYVVPDITEFSKIALKYKSGEIALWMNGNEVLTSASSLNISGLNQISFNKAGGTDIINGKVKSLLYFNEALTDAELERLTSSDITQVLRNYNRRGELLGATYESTHVQTKLNELF